MQQGRPLVLRTPEALAQWLSSDLSKLDLLAIQIDVLTVADLCHGAVVGGYGFVVWMYQFFTGPPSY